MTVVIIVTKKVYNNQSQIIINYYTVGQIIFAALCKGPVHHTCAHFSCYICIN